MDYAEILDYTCVAIGLSTYLIFNFKIEWFFNKKPRNIILLIDIVLLVIPLIFGVRNSKDFLFLLQMPLISLLIFLLFYYIFKKNFNRNPINTAHFAFRPKEDEDKKVRIEDVIFSILFFIIGIGGAFVFVALLYF